jgi:hypothetical protein
MPKLTITTKPFVSQAQAGWAFATGQPFARRWARQTGPYKRLPYKKRKKSYTLDQLEAFVSSAHYDPQTASLIALGIPELPRFKGEQIAPGITRIRGNLCNVHGRYGPCDKGLRTTPPVKKPAKGRARKPAKPKQTDAQRAAERDTKRQANVQSVGQRMADTDTGLSPSGVKALTAFAQGQQPDATQGAGLAQMGLAERASDGTYRMTPTGRAVVSAMQAGDYQRAVDAISRGTDAQGKRTERQTARQTRQEAARARQAEIATRRQAAAAERAKRQAERAQAKPAKAGAGGGKKPEAQAVEKPLKVRPTKRLARSSAPSVGGGVAGASPKKPPSPPAAQPEQEPAKQIAPALQEAAQNLSDGKELSEADTQALIRNGLARIVKGELVLTAAGQRQTMKDYQSSPHTHPVVAVASPGVTVMLPSLRTAISNTDRQARQRTDSFSRGAAQRTQTYAQNGQGDSHAVVPKKSAAACAAVRIDGISIPPVASITPSFRVFKDASGRYRWVAQSSTAFQDRDKEIVSTKALADDCAFADETGSYGPLRWWHSPGLDLGDCDFNAMHGRVLIESGTFRTPAIAQKVAAAADGLEISLGFLHLPTEPDADGVFHHIRRFERSLVPRGKASNRFTAFTVKEIPMLDATKVAALKTLGFSDADITNLQTQAAATEKAADAEQVAYKADEPAALPDIVINGVTYKALPPTPPTAEDVIEEDAIGDMPMEMEEEATGGLTLSPEDLAAITEVFQAGLAQVMGALDLEKKVAGHVQGLLAPYTAQKDASDAERAGQIAQLQTALKAAQEQQAALKTQLDELLGLQPAVKAERPSESTTTAINPWVPQDAQLLEAIKNQVSPNNQFAFGDLVENLFGNQQTPGQA